MGWIRGRRARALRASAAKREEMSPLHKHDFMSGYVYPMAQPAIQSVWDGHSQEGRQLSLRAGYPDGLVGPVGEAGITPVCSGGWGWSGSSLVRGWWDVKRHPKCKRKGELICASIAPHKGNYKHGFELLCTTLTLTLEMLCSTSNHKLVESQNGFG